MRTITEWNYDGLGRRTLVRDAGSTGMRTLYDGRSFEVIRESEVFADGSFTVNWNTGITGSPVGEESDGGRYRWIDDETNSGNLGGRYRSIDEGYGKEERYTGIKTSLYAKGEAAGVNLTGGRGNSRGGRMYLGTDILGSVRSVSGEYGNEEARYEYDVFGAPYEGEFTQGLTGGYTGKPYDAVTGLYNYGYRDYKPESARFTTVDPIRDGSNWYSYVMNDPVNYTDVWGLLDAAVIQDTLKQLEQISNTIPPAAVVVTVIVVIDTATNGAISNAVSNVSNTVTEKISDIYGAAAEGISNIITAVSNKINNKDPGKGNKVPPGNRPVEPTGKGANMGPENIPDPSKLGEPGNIPPDNDGNGYKTLAIVGGTSLLIEELDEFTMDTINQNKKNIAKKAGKGD